MKNNSSLKVGDGSFATRILSEIKGFESTSTCGRRTSDVAGPRDRRIGHCNDCNRSVLADSGLTTTFGTKARVYDYGTTLHSVHATPNPNTAPRNGTVHEDTCLHRALLRFHAAFLPVNWLKHFVKVSWLKPLPFRTVVSLQVAATAKRNGNIATDPYPTDQGFSSLSHRTPVNILL